MSVPAAAFKAECLKLMDRVARTGEAVVITKHGKPVAQLVPIPAEPKSMFGYLKGTVQIRGDIVAPVGESWSALSGNEDALFSRGKAKPRARRK
jgi:prevent-host-death family protein